VIQGRPLFSQLSSSSISRSLLSGDQPESPNTVLRRTLNIAPPGPPDTSQRTTPAGSHVNTFQPVRAFLPDLTASAQKPLENSTTVLSGAAKVECSDYVHADMTSSLSPTGLITPQALLQSQLTAKVRCCGNLRFLFCNSCQ